ncbi:Flp family type IVb pilin [Dongia deserti]|uniref:Flp family type IVb pilin n=1 Tax=Dongia deserti TaxID=2268030 RepID=UPI002546AD94|nr:Flp family type IVb pilin [Dongia deserti]
MVDQFDTAVTGDLTMLRFYRRLREDELGATAVEYGLIAGLISVVIITSLVAVENAMTGAFNYISSNIDSALN